MDDETQVSDEQIARCFGKQKTCSRNCRLKEVCLGKHREQDEEYRRRKHREAHYIDGMDAGAGHVAAEFVAEDTGPAETTEEILDAIEQLDLSETCRSALRRLARQKTETEDTKRALLDMLRKLGEVYVCDPTGFEVLFFQVLAGGHQAALAKMRGCSKQNINKSVARGKSRIEAYRAMADRHPGCRLTPRELAVFHAVELDGMSYREAAEICGCSHTTIRRVFQKLRSNGVKCSKKRTGRKKATKKATARRRQGGLMLAIRQPEPEV